MAQVTVQETSSGFLPVISWGNGADGDREAYAMTYDDLSTAERIAKAWADEQGADYVPFKPNAPDASRRQSLLVKQLRETEGLDLRTAVARAREIIASTQS